MDVFPLQRMIATSQEYREDPPRSESQGSETRYLNDPLRPADTWDPIPLVTEEVPVLWDVNARQ